MTKWIDPIDKVPQIKVDWSNHIIYGGILGFIAWPILLNYGVDYPSLWSLLIVFVFAACKKIVDFFKEHEALSLCVYKTLVSCVFPAAFVIACILDHSLKGN